MICLIGTAWGIAYSPATSGVFTELKGMFCRNAKCPEDGLRRPLAVRSDLSGSIPTTATTRRSTARIEL
jgi:hypothetical protein